MYFKNPDLFLGSKAGTEEKEVIHDLKGILILSSWAKNNNDKCFSHLFGGLGAI